MALCDLFRDVVLDMSNATPRTRKEWTWCYCCAKKKKIFFITSGRKENASEKRKVESGLKPVSPGAKTAGRDERCDGRGLGRPAPKSRWNTSGVGHTHFEHLVGRRVHAQPAFQHRVAVQLQQSHVQADDGRVGLGPEDHFHFAVVRDVVFGHRPAVVVVQLRVQEHLVALRLDGQKRYLVVRDARVFSLLYQRITIYVLNNDNIDPISVHIFSLAYTLHGGLRVVRKIVLSFSHVFGKKRRKRKKQYSFSILVSRQWSFGNFRKQMKNWKYKNNGLLKLSRVVFFIDICDVRTSYIYVCGFSKHFIILSLS